MLTHLTINNFAIVEHLSIDFEPGMTAITGETGAGKSIAIDALGLCLGNRADLNAIRPGAQRADITADFVLNDTPSALSWLQAQQLDDEQNCILRRVISQDGRSKAFINGRAVPLAQLRELGDKLIQIHGQHEHQLLLKSDHQRLLLDNYLGKTALLTQMKQQFQAWKQARKQLAEYQQARQQREAQQQLLEYQLKELNEFAPIDGEYEQIDEEYKRLSNSEQLLHLSQQAIRLLAEDDQQNLLSQLHSAKHLLQNLIEIDPKLSAVYSMLDEAAIQITEAGNELRYYSDGLEFDGERVQQLEQRLAKQVALARKHHIQPEALPQFHQQLLAEYQQIEQQDEAEAELKQQLEQLYQQALQTAEALHQQRQKHSKTLSKAISQLMQELAMPNGQFAIEVNYHPEQLSEEGADQITFLVSTNPGQALQPIAKVASGGELSRIALAIQVLTAQKMETPALIFDEIDVGISGPTAARVGGLLRQLGQSTQVITVTHLPQVAGNAHQHLFVSKQNDQQQTNTQMVPLDHQGRIEELARLLGGDKITRNTLANAEELIITD